LDDSSRKILAWKLSATMGAADVTGALDLARAATGVDRARASLAIAIEPARANQA